jgi:hypothetical protein
MRMFLNRRPRMSLTYSLPIIIIIIIIIFAH